MTPVTPLWFCLTLFTSDLDDDHFDVYSELRVVAVKWRSIGFALRLKRDVLDSIQGGNSGSAACLSSAVREWLSRNYYVEKFGEPTWQQLVEAVGHSAGGANVALAREIARRHKTKGTLFGSAFIICKHNLLSQFRNSVFTHSGLVDSVIFLTAGPQMLTVTQQASTSPQGVTETQMSKTVTGCLKFTIVICLATHSWLFLDSGQVNHFTPSQSPTTPPLHPPWNLLWFRV